MKMDRREFLHSSILLMASSAAARTLPETEQENASDERFWSEIRAQFPIDPAVVQLNNAAIGCPPRSVISAVERYASQLTARPSSSY